MAPPFTFTFFGSSLSSFTTPSDWAAKASFSSRISRSSAESFAFSSADDLEILVQNEYAKILYYVLFLFRGADPIEGS